ncbi:CRISPR-associated protein Cas2 [Companilactobacillus mindensis DSM 14500]|jgi:CRISPR-associated protein Cas2|uniref:CRISPR-associated endoribonuclease Cas2 n=2 Tax=Companilactobacillus mindensis TaxID=167481 RepID=A0A0R1QFE0_9LACO|nr:CRISPR-associated protein Cas2 [Companilactobacillus mindensis DSM 14500]
MIMFDLPTLTATDRRNYRQFRKHLLKDGFTMMQESIYTCILIDSQSAHLLEKKISVYSPKKGLVQSMIVTEKQFASMNFLTGKAEKTIENTFERLTVI